TDYLHTGWWPTFNLADTFLVIGFIVIALLHARPERTRDTAPTPTKDHTTIGQVTDDRPRT
ncbi:MAG: signal peptidase II, partial [Pimelobacter sp.]|nr:signal peptidase II [Pimelobacter sp.]